MGRITLSNELKKKYQQFRWMSWKLNGAETHKWIRATKKTRWAVKNETNARCVDDRTENDHMRAKDNELSGNLFPFGHTTNSNATAIVYTFHACVIDIVIMGMGFIVAVAVAPLFIIFNSFKNKTGAIQIYQRKLKTTWTKNVKNIHSHTHAGIHVCCER